MKFAWWKVEILPSTAPIKMVKTKNWLSIVERITNHSSMKKSVGFYFLSGSIHQNRMDSVDSMKFTEWVVAFWNQMDSKSDIDPWLGLTLLNLNQRVCFGTILSQWFNFSPTSFWQRGINDSAAFLSSTLTNSPPLVLWVSQDRFLCITYLLIFYCHSLSSIPLRSIKGRFLIQILV